MGSALGRQRAGRRQMDGEAFLARVAIQPPAFLPSLLSPTELYQRQPASPGPPLPPPTRMARWLPADCELECAGGSGGLASSY